MPEGDAAFDLYYRSNRSEVAAFLPQRIGRALDIGCAGGRFAAGLKTRPRPDGPGEPEVWGIEPNPAVADEASARLDRFLLGTFREVEGQLPDKGFDLIVCNDVLEHMADVFEVLPDLKRYLTPDGKIVASIPNVRSWPALMTIFWHGDFPYQEEGIFDRTHLRFFTHRSILRMFEVAGYQVERCEGINRMVGRKLRIANFLTRGRFWDSAFLQFVVVARPKT